MRPPRVAVVCLRSRGSGESAGQATPSGTNMLRAASRLHRSIDADHLSGTARECSQREVAVTSRTTLLGARRAAPSASCRRGYSATRRKGTRRRSFPRDLTLTDPVTLHLGLRKPSTANARPRVGERVCPGRVRATPRPERVPSSARTPRGRPDVLPGVADVRVSAYEQHLSSSCSTRVAHCSLALELRYLMAGIAMRRRRQL